MTLTQLLRPVQKGVGRLLLAGTNNAVGQNAAVDPANFREQQPQLQPQVQPHQHQPALGEAALQAHHQPCLPAAAVLAPFTPTFAAPFAPAGVPAQALLHGSQGFAELASQCLQSGGADSQGAPQAWQLGGRWATAGEPFTAQGLIAGFYGQGGAASIEQSASSSSPSHESADAGAEPGPSTAAGPSGWWHSDTRWRQLDARWSVGAVVWPVLLQMPHQQAALEPASPSSLGTPLPGRTGASRRQRRKQQQQLQQHHHQQLQLQLQQQVAAVAPALDAEWSEAPPLAALLPQTTLQALTAVAELDAGRKRPAAASEPPEGESNPSLATEEAARRHGGKEEEEGSSGACMPSLLFPPTPESTPSNSPRLWFGSAQAAAEAPCWPEPAAAPAAAAQVAAAPQSRPPKEAKLQPSEAECEAALSQLSTGGAGQNRGLLQWVLDLAWPLASSPAGCRVVQRALDVASVSEQAALAEQLKGRVREASTSPHANHVLQKCVELLPPDRLHFVLEEMQGHAVNAARHRYGCRVLERLIEHCPAWQTQALVEEVLAGAAQLCRHTFGNFVVQHVLEHGTSPQRHALAELLYADIQRLARHRVASHVVRCALVHCSPEDRQRLVAAMRADAGELADLAHHHCGSFVVREMRREMRR